MKFIERLLFKEITTHFTDIKRSVNQKLPLFGNFSDSFFPAVKTNIQQFFRFGVLCLIDIAALFLAD
jgi:hypothetical protein